MKPGEEPISPIDHLETIVDFWAIDETLTRIRGHLNALNEMLEPTEMPEWGDDGTQTL